MRGGVPPDGEEKQEKGVFGNMMDGIGNMFASTPAPPTGAPPAAAAPTGAPPAGTAPNTGGRRRSRRRSYRKRR